MAADDGEVLGELLAFASALHWAGQGRLNVPPECDAIELLTELGCTPQRALRNMRRGIDALSGRPGAYFGRISLGIG